MHVVHVHVGTVHTNLSEMHILYLPVHVRTGSVPASCSLRGLLGVLLRVISAVDKKSGTAKLAAPPRRRLSPACWLWLTVYFAGNHRRKEASRMQSNRYGHTQKLERLSSLEEFPVFHYKKYYYSNDNVFTTNTCTIHPRSR